MTPELTELRDSARQVLAAEGLAAPESRAWPLVLDLGWLLVTVPEAYGGLEQDIAGGCVFQAELGRSLCAAPYLAATLAVDAAVHAPSGDRASWIGLCTQQLVTASLADSALRIDAARVLSGVATAVPSADRASHMLVRSADGTCIAYVALQQAGVECRYRETWDGTRRLFDVSFSDVQLDAALILASGADALALSRRLDVHRDFALAADAVGGAGAILDITVEYLKTRRQFGRPLALFQALKHRCADLKANVASAEALLSDSLQRAGGALSEIPASMLGKAAKSYACGAYARVVEEALQLHGGIGMTADHPCHLFLKRAMLNEQLGGGTDDADVAGYLLSQVG